MRVCDTCTNLSEPAEFECVGCGEDLCLQCDQGAPNEPTCPCCADEERDDALGEGDE